MPSPFVAPYTSTKFALNGFFGAFGHELAMKKSNVSVSICTLGLIDTESAMEKVRLVKHAPNITDTSDTFILIGLLFTFFSQLLSIIGKTNIYLSLRGYTDLPAYPASEAALNIITTGTTRQPELFYPWFTRVVALSKDWFPSITSYVIQNSYNYNP